MLNNCNTVFDFCTTVSGDGSASIWWEEEIIWRLHSLCCLISLNVSAILMKSYCNMNKTENQDLWSSGLQRWKTVKRFSNTNYPVVKIWKLFLNSCVPHSPGWRGVQFKSQHPQCYCYRAFVHISTSSLHICTNTTNSGYYRFWGKICC